MPVQAIRRKLYRWKTFMANTYPEVLGEWVKRRESARRDRNLVAFLAVRDDVKAAVDEGYAVKTIWANMHENKRVAFGYDTFLNYVNRYIRRPPSTPSVVVPARPDSSLVSNPPRNFPAINPKETAPKAHTPEVLPGFIFNSTPTKEDLI